MQRKCISILGESTNYHISNRLFIRVTRTFLCSSRIWIRVDFFTTKRSLHLTCSLTQLLSRIPIEVIVEMVKNLNF